MSAWFRFYNSALDDPKVQRLDPLLFKTWVNFLCLAARTNGNVSRNVTDVSFAFRMTVSETEGVIKQLSDAGLIDVTAKSYRPHNWDKRQYKSDSSTDRVKRFRERSKTVTVTAPDTDTDTDTDNNPTGRNPAPPPEPSPLPNETPDARLYRRGKEVLGKSAGGMIRKLIAAKGGSIAQAHAAIETASEKADPSEYIGAIINSRNRLRSADELRIAGEAW